MLPRHLVKTEKDSEARDLNKKAREREREKERERDREIEREN